MIGAGINRIGLRGRLWLRVLAVLGVGSLLASPVAARVWTTPDTQTRDILWNGGDLQVVLDVCVQSTSVGGPTGGAVLPYAILPTVPLVLTSGANQIPVIMTWTDLAASNTVSLVHNASTGFVFTGRADQGCAAGINGRWQISATEASILAVPPNIYAQTLIVEASNTGAGPNDRPISMTINLTIPDSIRISAVSDIDLGMFSGATMQGSDSLCVFRASGGTYSIMVTGQGVGGAYSLSNGADSIPFSVAWNDGAGAQTLDPGVPLGGRLNSFVGNDSCNAGAANNASIEVTVEAADIEIAPVGGDYAGILTLTVGIE